MPDINRKNPYTVLGITEPYCEEAIKKRYRELSKRWHPDMVKEEDGRYASDRFSEISEAYSLLCPEDRRVKTDEEMDLMRRSSFGEYSYRKIKGVDSVVNLGVTIREIHEGAAKRFEYTKTEQCVECGGYGGYSRSVKCPSCNGKGYVVKPASFIGNLEMAILPVTCPKCDGTGKIAPTGCPVCGGSGVTRAKAKITLILDKTLHDGSVIRMDGKGGWPRNAIDDSVMTEYVNGDLIINIKVKKDDYYTSFENGILVKEFRIGFSEAIQGYSLKVKSMDGEELEVSGKMTVLEPSDTVFKGKGVGGRDLVARVIPVVKSEPDERQKELLGEYSRIEKEKNDDKQN